MVFTIHAKNLRRNRVSLSDGGLSCSDGGYSPLVAPPLYVQETFLVSLTSKSTQMPRIFLHKNTFLVHLLNSLGNNNRY